MRSKRVMGLALGALLISLSLTACGGIQLPWQSRPTSWIGTEDLGSTQHDVIYLSWTDNSGKLSGQFQAVAPDYANQPGPADYVNLPLTGSVSGGQINISISQSGGQPYTATGSINDSALQLEGTALTWLGGLGPNTNQPMSLDLKPSGYAGYKIATSALVQSAKKSIAKTSAQGATLYQATFVKKVEGDLVAAQTAADAIAAEGAQLKAFGTQGNKGTSRVCLTFSQGQQESVLNVALNRNEFSLQNALDTLTQDAQAALQAISLNDGNYESMWPIRAKKDAEAARATIQSDLDTVSQLQAVQTTAEGERQTANSAMSGWPCG